MYLGAEYKGPHGDHLYPMTPREIAIATPLLAFAILFGVYPQAMLSYITPTVNQQALTLAEWTKDVKSKEQPATATIDHSDSPSASASSRVARQGPRSRRRRNIGEINK